MFGFPGMAERRGKLRFEIRLTCEIVQLQSGRKTYGKTSNISSSGILFTSDEPIPVDTLVDLWIALPHVRRARRDVCLCLSGRVVRAEDSRCTFAAYVNRYRFLRQARVRKCVEVAVARKDGLLVDVLDSVERAEETVGYGSHVQPVRADGVLPFADCPDELLERSGCGDRVRG